VLYGIRPHSASAAARSAIIARSSAARVACRAASAVTRASAWRACASASSASRWHGTERLCVIETGIAAGASAAAFLALNAPMRFVPEIRKRKSLAQLIRRSRAALEGAVLLPKHLDSRVALGHLAQGSAVARACAASRWRVCFTRSVSSARSIDQVASSASCCARSVCMAL
jgi:hypothetical protein